MKTAYSCATTAERKHRRDHLPGRPLTAAAFLLARWCSPCSCLCHRAHHARRDPVLPQTFQEEVEFQQGIDDVRGRRRAAGSAPASVQPSQAALIAQQERAAAAQLADAALLYARCLQRLIQVSYTVAYVSLFTTCFWIVMTCTCVVCVLRGSGARSGQQQRRSPVWLYCGCTTCPLPLSHADLTQAQSSALSQEFGVSTDLCGLLRQLWLSLLPTSGLLELRPQEQQRRRSAPVTAPAAATAAAAAAAAAAAVAASSSDHCSDSDDDNDGNEDDVDAVGGDHPREGTTSRAHSSFGPSGLFDLRAAQLVAPHVLKRLLWKVTVCVCVCPVPKCVRECHYPSRAAPSSCRKPPPHELGWPHLYRHPSCRVPPSCYCVPPLYCYWTAIAPASPRAVGAPPGDTAAVIPRLRSAA